MKFLRVLCVLAIALCLTASVYAETQSVKVSGDLTVRAIARDAYDHEGSPNETPTLGGIDQSQQTWLMSTAAVQVDADLTDNVSTVIRLVNQRDWDVKSKYEMHGSFTLSGSPTPYLDNQDEFNVMVDLAYVTLKNFVYSPLTLTIGRQDLWFGKGFIIGANQQNPGNGVLEKLLGTVNDPHMLVPGNLSAPEYTAINSFDAIKAVLDYDPWTITAFYAKISEGAIQANDDVNLWGLNVGYKFDAYKGEVEGYWFWKNDRSIPITSGLKNNTNDVHTIGLRGSCDPIDCITVSGEGAYQGGQYVAATDQDYNRSRSAWALDFSGEWRYLSDKLAWKPKLGLEYVYYSGNQPDSDPEDGDGGGTYTGWDPMFRGKFDSAIREFVGKFYCTYRYPSIGGGTTVNIYPDSAQTNQHQMIIRGSIQPIESLTLKANYNFFFTDQDYLPSNSKSGGFIGQEIDVQATWDYTEDVSFNLLCGWFIPNEVYFASKGDTATDLVGTVKVSF